MLEQLAGFDPLLQVWIESQHAVEPKHLGDEVVGEGREPVEAGQIGETGPRHVGGGNLGALEEGDRATLVGRDVGEGAPAGKQVGERRRRAVGGLDHGPEATAVLILAHARQRRAGRQ